MLLTDEEAASIKDTVSLGEPSDKAREAAVENPYALPDEPVAKPKTKEQEAADDEKKMLALAEDKV